MTDLSSLSVHELSAGLAARRFSPVDVVGACLARIEKYEPRLQAFVNVHANEARMAAEAADTGLGRCMACRWR